MQDPLNSTLHLLASAGVEYDAPAFATGVMPWVQHCPDVQQILLSHALGVFT